MKRFQLYKELLWEILKSYSGITKRTDEYEDIQDFLEDGNISQALRCLTISTSLRHELKPLLITIYNFIEDESVDLSDDVSVGGQIKIFQSHHDKKYSRSLAYYSANLNVVETCTLYKSDDETYSLECLMFLETIMTSQKRRKDLLRELCKKEKKQTYIIQVNKTSMGLSTKEANNFENLYSYALAAYMNDKKVIAIPEELKFTWGTAPILSSFVYNKEIIYQEYYDIYDVFNDWLHATDILTAFLKMYQIAEYMVYRSQMAEIVNRANIKQSFLRETKNLSSRYTKNERDTIVSNFIILFHDFILSPTEVTNSWTFVDKYYGMTKSGNHYLDATNSQLDIDKGVARFVYDTRCAIVHNKESEFHILYNNYEEYQEIVPLMKSINDIMASKILEIINTQGSILHYEHQKLDLY
jgi:hypothetical protein